MPSCPPSARFGLVAFVSGLEVELEGNAIATDVFVTGTYIICHYITSKTL